LNGRGLDMNKNIMFAISLVLVLMISACTPYEYEPTGEVVMDVGEESTDVADIQDVEEIVEEAEIVEGEVEEVEVVLEEEPTEDVEEEMTEEELDAEIQKILDEIEAELAEDELEEEPTEEVGEEVVVEEEPVVEETQELEEVIGEVDILVYEGDLIDLKPYVMDPDGDEVSLGYTAPFDELGMWQTQDGDAGFYSTIVTATDNKGSFVTKQIVLNVLIVNNPPVINIAKNLEFDEGDLVKLNSDIYDEDGDEVVVIYSGWMDSRTYQTDYDDAGTYTVTIKADDGKIIVMEDVTIVINDVNRMPTLTILSGEMITVTEEDIVEIMVESNDPDGNEVTYTFSKPLDENGMWETARGDAGEYEVTVTATDGDNFVIQTIDLVVDKKNTAPVIDSVKVTPEFVELRAPGDEVTIKVLVEASDVDGDALTVSYSGYMSADEGIVRYGDKGGDKTVTVTVSDGTESVSQDVVFNMNNWPCFDCQ
jgi:hypothetical protein